MSGRPAKPQLMMAVLFGALGLADLVLLDLVLWPRYIEAKRRPVAATAPSDTTRPQTARPARRDATPGKPSTTGTKTSSPRAVSRPDPWSKAKATDRGVSGTIPNKYLGLLDNPPNITIRFLVNRTDLPPHARRELGGFARKHQAGSTRFLIVGHTDGQGDEGYNELLGMQRALAVALELSRLGIPKIRILDPVSQGSSTPAGSGNGAQQRADNRRVEVYLAR